MPLDVERVVDRRVRLEKSLRRCSTLEPLHLALASSNAEVRVLGAVVFAQPTRPMSIAETQALKRSSIGAKSVCHNDFKLDVLILQ